MIAMVEPTLGESVLNRWPDSPVPSRLASLPELIEYLPPDRAVEWLCDQERELWSGHRSLERRDSWLYGRLLAKSLIRDETTAPIGETEAGPSKVEIYSRDGLGRGIRPWVMVSGRTLSGSLSIAHSRRSVFVALSRTGSVDVGVDLTAIGSVTDSVIRLWLTPREQQWVDGAGGHERSRRAASVWAVKEAFYKATNTGESFMPGRIEVRPVGHSFEVGPASGPGIATARSLSRCQVWLFETAGEIAVIVTTAKAGERR